jgi:hypothetical protein
MLLEVPRLNNIIDLLLRCQWVPNDAAYQSPLNRPEFSRNGPTTWQNARAIGERLSSLPALIHATALGGGKQYRYLDFPAKGGPCSNRSLISGLAYLWRYTGETRFPVGPGAGWNQIERQMIDANERAGMLGDVAQARDEVWRKLPPKIICPWYDCGAGRRLEGSNIESCNVPVLEMLKRVRSE